MMRTLRAIFLAASLVPLLAAAQAPAPSARSGGGHRSSTGLEWDQPVCFVNGGTHASFGAIRGYIWWGDGEGSKSFDTQPRSTQRLDQFDKDHCVVLKKGSKSGRIRVTVGPAAVPTATAWPAACDVTLPLQPFAMDAAKPPPPGTTLWVVGKGNVGTLRCEFCTGGNKSEPALKKCSGQLPAPAP